LTNDREDPVKRIGFSRRYPISKRFLGSVKKVQLLISQQANIKILTNTVNLTTTKKSSKSFWQK
jgi:hypothetical protein